MRLEPTPTVRADVLVIGSGAAGLRAAIAARQRGADVRIISESPVGFRSNTAIARAVFATSGVWGKAGDSAAVHRDDIIAGGRYIGDPRLATAMTSAVRRQVDDLREFGVSFIERDGAMLVGRAPGHSFPRHVNVRQNRGINITRPMRHYAAGLGVGFIEGVCVTRLLRSGERMVGVLGIDARGKSLVATAPATVLATGGGGKVYLRTNNAIGSTGDGYALAYQAGAVLRDMEFVQFYPTGWGDQPARMVFYEGLLPLGAVIRNSLGEDVLLKNGLTDFTKVTRDVLARTIMAEITAGRGIDGSLIFDLAAVPEERTSALRRVREMSQAGDRDRLPVAPTVHFFMGGVRIGASTETGIDGLFAAGEVCGGLHGANRLGGNAISETLVFGTIAGERAAAETAVAAPAAPEGEVSAGLDNLRSLASGSREEDLGELRLALRRTMWQRAGVVREAFGLEAALGDIEELRGRLAAASLTGPVELFDAVKLDNMLTVSEMICRAALLRTESRGAHFRSNFPEEDDGRWLKTIEIRHGRGGMQLAVAPVSEDTGG